jgi:hypothetical protein
VRRLYLVDIILGRNMTFEVLRTEFEATTKSNRVVPQALLA